jgi:GxxExxY protein
MSELDDPLTERIIGCAIEVHRGTGAGLLESVYDVCLAYELKAAGLTFRTQCSVPFEYKSLSIKNAFLADFVVEEHVLVELKAVETLLPVHRAQVLTYLKLTGLTRGLLLNFNVSVLKDGIRRVVWTPPS